MEETWGQVLGKLRGFFALSGHATLYKFQQVHQTGSSLNLLLLNF